jgi:hypothetical protein
MPVTVVAKHLGYMSENKLVVYLCRIGINK